MASDAMTVTALGRSFALGMLYNAHKDELIPGFTLWHEKTINANKTVTPKPYTEFEVSTSNSMAERLNQLDVDASLKASFLSGMVEVSGSASYLSSQKQRTNQSRVTLHYKVVTRNERLLATDVGHVDLAEKSTIASHVVVEIIYGARAVFTFDCERSDSGSDENISGKMHAVIKKIPFLKIDGDAQLKLTNEEKNFSQTFSCTFFGDFLLPRNPTTFEQAVEIYAELPSLLGKKDENVVPMQVRLLPLQSLQLSNAPPVKHISVELLLKVQNTVEDVHHLIARCNTLLEDDVVKSFPQLQDQVNLFKTYLDDYIAEVQQTLSTELPSVRAGASDEKSVANIFDQRDKTAFSQKKLSKWLDDKEREVNVMRPCLEIMTGIKLLPTKSDFDKVVLDFKTETALCFVFTSLQSADPYLDVLASQLKLKDAADAPSPAVPWYSSDDMVTKVRQKATIVHKESKTGKFNSYLIAVLVNKKYNGASIYQYKNGRLVTDDFFE